MIWPQLHEPYIGTCIDIEVQEPLQELDVIEQIPFGALPILLIAEQQTTRLQHALHQIRGIIIRLDYLQLLFLYILNCLLRRL